MQAEEVKTWSRMFKGTISQTEYYQKKAVEYEIRLRELET